MLRDHYDNPVTTGSAAALDAYDAGVRALLAAQVGIDAAFDRALAHDEGFALAHAAKARARMMADDPPGAQAAIARAQALAGPDGRGVTAREAGHIAALALMIAGKGPQAYAAIRAHVAEHPRDALIAQTCSSVFGLIGFSGQPGREAEMLAFNSILSPHYGEDWWMLSQYAFSLCETGRLAEASRYIDRSLALNPDSAHGAHIRAHVWYEQGDVDAGRGYLADWLKGYDRRAMLHCHIAWHVALWALQQGEEAAMWALVDDAVAPDSQVSGPRINVLTDSAAILFRAEALGATVNPARWRAVSAYAATFFAQTGNAFVDMHAALAHAMAGDGEALARIIAHPAGPAADLTPDVAAGWRAIAVGQWAAATAHLTRAMADHARLGGSRAQRDLLEIALLTCLLRQGKAEEARRLAALRRPMLAGVVEHGAHFGAAAQ